MPYERAMAAPLAGTESATDPRTPDHRTGSSFPVPGDDHSVLHAHVKAAVLGSRCAIKYIADSQLHYTWLNLCYMLNDAVFLQGGTAARGHLPVITRQRGQRGNDQRCCRESVEGGRSGGQCRICFSAAQAGLLHAGRRWLRQRRGGGGGVFRVGSITWCASEWSRDTMACHNV